MQAALRGCRSCRRGPAPGCLMCVSCRRRRAPWRLGRFLRRIPRRIPSPVTRAHHLGPHGGSPWPHEPPAPSGGRLPAVGVSAAAAKRAWGAPKGAANWDGACLWGLHMVGMADGQELHHR